MEIPNLVDKLYDTARANMEIYPCNSNRASMIGADCERQLVYWRTAWEQAMPHDVDLQLIFNEGNLHEQAVLSDLAKAGVQVIHQQVPADWKRFQLTGHVDGVIVVDGKAVALEIKSMSSHIWHSVAFRGAGAYEWKEVAGAFQSKPWLRKYYAQLQVYLITKDAEHAILLLKDKTSGALAQVHVALDFEYAEELLLRAERINEHVANGTLPERIPFNEESCSERFCPFLHLCLPDHLGKDPIAFVDDDTAHERLDKRDELEQASREFNAIDAWVKDWIWKAHEKDERFTVNGTWLIEKSLSAKGRKSTKITRLPTPDSEAA